MIGVVICAHGNLANELLATANFITGNAGRMTAVAMDHNVDPASARGVIKDAILNADEGSGVLVLTDMYGGTPSNICISLQDELGIEIIAGVNLPMLLKAASVQKNSDLQTMSAKVRDYGKENIILASDFLRKKNAAGEG
ncbi:MAG: PTS sugar transporter subunit IIA [Nitrospinae bacterium]|nr:PTS sugar transporter subunit IIA [Nitrospinota bacterium]